MPFCHKFTMYNIQTADLLFAMYRPLPQKWSKDVYTGMKCCRVPMHGIHENWTSIIYFVRNSHLHIIVGKLNGRNAANNEHTNKSTQATCRNYICTLKKTHMHIIMYLNKTAQCLHTNSLVPRRHLQGGKRLVHVHIKNFRNAQDLACHVINCHDNTHRNASTAQE